jgi:hypothetical protein
MSIRIMSAVFECETMTHTQKLVALALADHCHDDGTEARPGMARLMRKTSLSERAIQYAIKSLVRDGFIALQRKSTATETNVYRFTMGGASRAPDAPNSVKGCTKCARGVHHVHPNHQEPSLNQGDSQIVDLEAVRKRNDEIFNRSRTSEADPGNP